MDHDVPDPAYELAGPTDGLVPGEDSGVNAPPMARVPMCCRATGTALLGVPTPQACPLGLHP